MATTIEDPQDSLRRATDDRILATLNALEKLKSGGTAMEIREAMFELGNGAIAHLRTVRRDLWLLKRLGLATYTCESGIRSWKSTRVSDQSTN